MLTINTITNLNSPFYDEDQWGQFIDIERQQLFPKQIIHYVTTIKTETKTITTVTTTPPLKSILKKNNKPENTRDERKEMQKGKKNTTTNENYKNQKYKGYNNNQFQKFIEKQLYIGCLICILTFGFCLLP
jgi:hypothetical protein